MAGVSAKTSDVGDPTILQPSHQQESYKNSRLHIFAAHDDDVRRHLSQLESPLTEHNKKLLPDVLSDLPNDGEPNIFLAYQEVTFIDKKIFLRKVNIGKENVAKNHQHKIVMLLGETGSGKSTLINTMFNYIVGVDFQDRFRLNLINQNKDEDGEIANQAKSQTNWITSYIIHQQEGFTIPFTLTIVDTPGFGHTAGIQRDQQIAKQITTFFETKCIDTIHAIGFVAQAPKCKLTPTQTYIFDSILSLFGNNIKENIFMLLTFAKGGELLVLRALKDGKIPYQQHFPFNNEKPFQEAKKMHFMQYYWDSGRESFNSFTKIMEGVQAKGVSLTNEVLKNREQLEQTLKMAESNIHGNIQLLQETETGHDEVLHLVNTARRCIVRLDELALRPNTRFARERINEFINVKQHQYGDKVKKVKELQGLKHENGAEAERLVDDKFDPCKRSSTNIKLRPQPGCSNDDVLCLPPVPHEANSEQHSPLQASPYARNSNQSVEQNSEDDSSFHQNSSLPDTTEVHHSSIPVISDKKKLLVEELCTLKSDSQSNIYLAKHKVTFSDDTILLRKVQIGNDCEANIQQHKVVLLVGATGSGKSTLINAMFNYIVGVDFQDNFRLRLIDNTENTVNKRNSQTKWITSYTIPHRDGFTIPFKLTIIDTPGFGDGIERDQSIISQINSCFATGGNSGIDAIDAVGFVVPSPQQRLTPTQSYIFDSILSLFGKDIDRNIFMLLTFADANEPGVLRALALAMVPYEKYFQFNSQVSQHQHSNLSPMERDMCQLNWDRNKDNFEAFIGELERIQTCSMVLTGSVLQERRQLEHVLEMIQNNIHLNTQLLEKLKHEQEVLRTYERDIDRKKDVSEQKCQQCVKMIEQLKEEIELVQNKTLRWMDIARRCIARLGEIALRPNMMSAAEYIDLLIEMDKHEGRTRLKSLMQAQERAAIAEKLLDKNFDPFERQVQERAAIAENILNDNVDSFGGCTLTHKVGKGGPLGKLKKFFCVCSDSNR